ncbi:hypothetical protein FHX42_000684 [Saccharopolyspora lacisalsi]|uniref:Uncharacterized protein n=1 Tax=Halosaccharopolyspora lacisalsi TaxID=1000566 RepID=A0A839DVN6_9PSEU|nr:hypothetical protein [Halosaccharopolyspora lacisalsi]
MPVIFANHSLQVRPYRRKVDTPPHAERPREGTTSFGQPQTLWIGMQPSTPARLSAMGIGDGDAMGTTVLGHHSEQLAGPSSGPAPHARTNRPVVVNTDTGGSWSDSRSLASSHL